jgi:threonylcarbamoyladenosine tRNA methylthiotransferase MtaB
MKRHYSASFFKDLLEKLVETIPDLAIGIDVIAGLPGEDAGAFEHTVQLIEDLPVAYLHVFPYSARPGTPAASMPAQVPSEEKKKTGGNPEKSGEHVNERPSRNSFRNRILRVLVEEREDRGSGLRKGFSDNYLPILLINSNASQVNHTVDVQVEEIDGTRIFGGSFLMNEERQLA